jgi:hypothetical protein
VLAGEPGIVLAGGVGFRSAGGLFGAGREPGPGREVRGGGEDGHVHAEFGDELLSAAQPDAADLIEFVFDRAAEIGDVRGQNGDPLEQLGAEQCVMIGEVSDQRFR